MHQFAEDSMSTPPNMLLFDAFRVFQMCATCVTMIYHDLYS